MIPAIEKTPEGLALQHHRADLHDFSLRDALQAPDRFVQFSHTACGILFDFSKHLITDETLIKLCALARARGVEDLRDAMFSGVKINTSEGRAVLHTALRAPATDSILVDGQNVIPDIHHVLDKMRQFSDAVRSGTHTGHTGQPITDIVNIGIGGSDLGPRFVVESLSSFASGPQVHFVSNVDGHDLSNVLAKLNPETTLFIVASKTFTTQETMQNAAMARDWVRQSLPAESIAKHFVALSTNIPAVTTFGILEENIFPFWDWVGGRYSLWSAIGLSIALAVGFDHFRALLDGAHAMDTHFRTTRLERNIPALMGLLGVWYTNFWDYRAHVILPYDTRLGKIAKFIQEMDMESHGKAVDRDGHPVPFNTGPAIFGEAGTDSQHSFMQWVHQSPMVTPADFIIAKTPAHSLAQNHTLLMANFLAQTRALAIGQTLEEAGGDPSRVFTGNRPTTSMILPELTPYTLGALIAAYEHKVFVQGAIWNLNSFDQPGVELGKKLAAPLADALSGKGPEAKFDASTQGLMSFLIA